MVIDVESRTGKTRNYPYNCIDLLVVFQKTGLDGIESAVYLSLSLGLFRGGMSSPHRRQTAGTPVPDSKPSLQQARIVHIMGTKAPT